MSKTRVDVTGRVILYFDGASRGNPGPSAAGIVVTAENGSVLCRRGVLLPEGTNNVAEYSGLLAGLEECQALGARRVEVVGDSELVVKQMTGEYRVRNATLRHYHQKVRNRMARFGGVTFRQVARDDNAEADAVCNLVFKRGRGFREDGQGGE